LSSRLSSVDRGRQTRLAPFESAALLILVAALTQILLLCLFAVWTELLLLLLTFLNVVVLLFDNFGLHFVLEHRRFGDRRGRRGVYFFGL